MTNSERRKLGRLDLPEHMVMMLKNESDFAGHSYAEVIAGRLAIMAESGDTDAAMCIVEILKMYYYANRNNQKSPQKA